MEVEDGVGCAKNLGPQISGPGHRFVYVSYPDIQGAVIQIGLENEWNQALKWTY